MKELANAAAKGEFQEKLKELSGKMASDVAGKYTDNENLKSLAQAAVEGNLKEKFGEVKGSLASDAVGQFTGNDKLGAIAKAAVEHELPQSLGEFSKDAVDKMFGGMLKDEGAAKALGPVMNYLKEHVSTKVMEEAMKLLPAAVGGGG